MTNPTEQAKRRNAAHAAAFLAVVIMANLATSQLGLVHWLGLIATAGTWLAGFAFVARDYLHESGGKWWVLGCIAVGAAVSALMSPRVALASAVAFMLAELADYAVYAPLRRAGYVRAAIASNVIGSIADTFLFLAIAGFPMSGAATQIFLKVALTTVFVIGLAIVVPRQPVQSEGGTGHA